MRIQNIREVKAKLSRIVSELPKEGSVIITKNGRACAVLMPVTDKIDLEAIAISQNRDFLESLRSGLERAEQESWTSLQSLNEAEEDRKLENAY